MRKPAAKKKAKNTQPMAQAGQSHSEDDVKLKPFFGIRPGIYLAFLYGAVILLVLFFVLLYPGISNPGSVLVVKTEPRGAAVLIDGAYMKAAPCEIFVPEGRRKIELRLPGFFPKIIEEDIDGRLFASLIFPLKVEINEKLNAPDPAASFGESAGEYAAWTFTGEPGTVYQVPLSLSEGAYRFGPSASDPAVRSAMNGILMASARFAVTRAALRDLVRAKTLIDNNGLSPSPLSLLGSSSDIIAYMEENPQAALWLGSLLTEDAQSELTDSSWYAEALSGGEKTELPLFAGNGVGNTRAGGFLRAGPLGFLMIPGGLSLLGNNFPAGTSPNDFYICETVASTEAWELFLEEHPEWKGENAVTMIEEGLASEEYAKLSDFRNSPKEGVSGISWYGASAFCEWLTSFLPPGMSSWEVRLPSEAEWEYAANAGALDDSGGFWEWCGDPYAPLSFLSVTETGADTLGSPERSVRGGSWINPPGSVTNETRGSLPPHLCSVFVSFRPVIAQKKSYSAGETR